VIDFNNLLLRGYSVHEHLSFAGKSTGGLYGFVTQFATLLSSHPTTDIIVCSASKPYLRSKIFPEYKLKRKKSQDPDKGKKLGQNSKMVEEFLALLGVKLWEEKGMEADDLIAAACDDYTDSFDRIIVASNDDDMYQLFRHDNIFFKSKKANKGTGVYGYDDFIEEYDGMSLRDWMRILYMAGTHNELPGIRGIGRKTAMKIIAEGTYRRTYKEHKKILDLHKKLIRLPFLDNLDVPFSATGPGFKERELMKFLAGYGIEYTGKMKYAFKILNDG